MGFKEKILERIEKNAIKIDVNDGFVYLKKSGFFKEWHIINPPINPETERINWNNFIFGGKGNAVKSTLIFLMAILLSIGISWIVKLI